MSITPLSSFFSLHLKSVKVHKNISLKPTGFSDKLKTENADKL